MDIGSGTVQEILAFMRNRECKLLDNGHLLTGVHHKQGEVGIARYRAKVKEQNYSASNISTKHSILEASPDSTSEEDYFEKELGNQCKRRRISQNDQGLSMKDD